MKRIFDFLLSLFGLLITWPIIIFFMLLVYLEDRGNPIYLGRRVGRKGREFNMIKIRSMHINAEKSGVDSTSENDSRITKIGHLVRKFKIDELTQLINILFGQMSFVGPRPNVKRDTKLYTDLEKRLLSVIPGLTDYASIVFSDESFILKDKEDPDISYNQLIRPWKSKLGLFYIERNNLFIDLCLIFITFIGLFSRKISLYMVYKLLKRNKAPIELLKISLRREVLMPTPPPGSDMIISSREI